MDIKNILRHVDHTVLSPDAVWEDVKLILDEAMECGAASACIPPSYVKAASEYVKGRLRICTVIGFPNGYSTTASKVFETEDAILNGADEIDMVINIGALKAGREDFVESEIKEIKKACGEKILKVIVECCLLTQEEKVEICRIVTRCGADYIKTSTGFSKHGATIEDIELFKAEIGASVKMKAAGGIRSLEDAQKYIELGCSRVGASAVIKAAKQLVEKE